MTILLGIETSCDETAAAVVADGRRIHASVVASQHALHAPHHGVVPELASRAHAERITVIIDRALGDAGVGPGDLDGVAVTARPGLIGALLVGVSAAKTYAWVHGLPLVDVDHIEAHVYSPCLETDLEPPYLALVASGGHTALYLTSAPGVLECLGRTRDDAAGEAFDKVAKMLGLGYPGGPLIDALATEGDPRAVELPRAMIGSESLDFSFSGLKTAVLYVLRGQDGSGPTAPVAPADLAASFQAALVDVLVAKLATAARRTGATRLALAGGVACNRALRAAAAALCADNGWTLHVPAPALCTDNAAMIAGLGFWGLTAGRRAGWDLEPLAAGR